MTRLPPLSARMALLGGCALSSILPAFSAEPAYVSPDQSAPGEVTFRLFAPNAKAVSVTGLHGQPEAAMTKSEEGVWSVTLRDLPPDIYSYTFNVDGLSVLDRHNRFLKRWTASESAVEVAGERPAVYSLQPVPHGILHHHRYKSAVAGREVGLQVYTPPGYDPRARTRYPLIVLCHGTGDDETSWEESGRANLIADNLIAQSAMKKAIIVMPYGHPVPLPLIKPTTYNGLNNPAMERAVLTEVLPLVEANYHVTRRPEERAIVGLSMGGGQALAIGLAHPEIFRWVGGFSAAAPQDDFGSHFAPWVAALHDKRHAPRLLWLAIGRNDALLPPNETVAAWLREKNVPFTWKVTEGGHEWTLWRQYFAEFAQAIFR